MRRACPGRGRRRTSDGLNSGVGSRAVLITSRRSPSAVDLMPSATSARTERNNAEPLTGPVLQFLGELADRAPAELDRVRHHGPDIPQLGELPGGIGHRAGRQGQAHRPARRGPGRHPGRAVQPGEAGAARAAGRPVPAGRYVHGGSAPDAVVHQGHRAGDEAARPGVEQGGHLLLLQAGHAGRRQVNAGKQRLPRAARAGCGTASHGRSCRGRAAARGWPRRTAAPGGRPDRRRMMFGACPENDTGVRQNGGPAW